MVRLQPASVSPSGATDIYLMKSGSSTPMMLNSLSGNYTGASLSPDGTKVAYTALDINGISQVYVASVSNFSNPTPLTTGTTYQHAYPVFSPDGATIASTVASMSSQSVLALDISTVPTANGPELIVKLSLSQLEALTAVFTCISSLPVSILLLRRRESETQISIRLTWMAPSRSG